MVATKDFLSSTDRYLLDYIKVTERLRRGSYDRLLKDGDASRWHVDWQLSIRNDHNKVQLKELLLKMWGSEAAASCLARCGNVSLVVDGKGYDFASSDDKVSTT